MKTAAINEIRALVTEAETSNNKEKLVEAIVRATELAHDEDTTAATKSDIERLKTELVKQIGDLKSDLIKEVGNVKSDLKSWVFTISLGIQGAIGIVLIFAVNYMLTHK